ncbi:MAG: DUF736 domain-containing protein [Lautropia sp.]
MANIGNFARSGNGFTGTVRTLSLNAAVRFVPNEKASENSPDFRVVTQKGFFEIGAAWSKTSREGDKPYLSVTLDDPSLPAPIYARLVDDGENVHSLIWSRPKAA